MENAIDILLNKIGFSYFVDFPNDPYKARYNSADLDKVLSYMNEFQGMFPGREFHLKIKGSISESIEARIKGSLKTPPFYFSDDGGKDEMAKNYLEFVGQSRGCENPAGKAAFLETLKPV
jgi:hypothetical protein